VAIDNDDQDSINEALQNLIPEDATRRKCFSFLANSIDTAYVLAPDRWGLTLRRNFLRLNGGMIEVLAIKFRDKVRCSLDLDSIPKELSQARRVQLVNNADAPKLGYYPSVPGSIVCDFLAGDLEEILPLVRGSHRLLLENAARTRTNGRTKKGHSPAVIDYLSSWLGRDLAQPTYLRG
jgi:hypothetical protein